MSAMGREVRILMDRPCDELEIRRALVFTQALALMKNPQNQGRIPRFFNRMFNRERKLAEAIR